jgi:triosephosphate isomerase
LKSVDLNSSDEIIIAYEPVWAIGTGRAATSEDANEVKANFIRTILALELDDSIAETIRILDGGNVKPDNAGNFYNRADIDGALVAGASLKAHDFVEIVRAALN